MEREELIRLALHRFRRADGMLRRYLEKRYAIPEYSLLSTGF